MTKDTISFTVITERTTFIEISRSKDLMPATRFYPSHLPHCGDTLYVPEFYCNVTVLSEVAPRSHMIQTSTERIKGIEGS